MVGERIFLRELEERDWEAVHAYASRPAACRFQPWGPNTEEQSRAFVQDVLDDAAQQPRTRYAYAVAELETGRMIGAAELNIRDVMHRQGEIGYIIHPERWGNGYATEAASLLLAIGFGTFGLHRIYATCDPRNGASAKVLEKIGMRREGVMRQTLLLRDGWRDSAIYSVLEDDAGISES